LKIIRPLTVSDAGSFTRASSAKYYDKSGVLQTATTDTPRFSYDPTTLIPIGLLEESAATNLLLYSEQADNAAWTKTNCSVTANATTAPDGNATADMITVSAATGGISQSVTVSNGVAYIDSLYAKANASSKIRVLDTVSGVQADYDLSTETATITSGSGTATIEQIGTLGWYRLYLAFTSTSTTATISIRNNDGTSSGSFYAWGMQLETGSAATSYITTTSSSATRAADVNTSGMISNVAENDYTAYSSTRVYNTGDFVMVVGSPGSGTHKIYQSLQGHSSTVTISIASPGVVSWTAHGFSAGTPIQFSTTGALPTGITAGTTYYVSTTNLFTNSFCISSIADGSGAINTSGTQSGVHTAVAGPNLNKTPADNPTYWLDYGNTNRWKMFDTSVQSQTSNADAVMVAIKLSSAIDTVTLLNIQGQGARILIRDATDGVVYDQLLDGINNDGVSDWYSYFFETIIYKTDFAVTGLPLYANATINIIVYNTGGTALCGVATAGLSRDIGATQVNAKIGIQDYSVKTRDNFGNFTITERAYAKRASFTIYCETTTVAFLANMLASYRATPVVYIGEVGDGFEPTIVYGFYKNFDIDIGYMDGLSVCSLDLEGLV